MDKRRDQVNLPDQFLERKIRDLTFELISINDRKIASEQVLQVLMEFDGIDCAGIYICNPITKNLELVAHCGLSEIFAKKNSLLKQDDSRVKILRADKVLFLDYSEVKALNGKSLEKEGLLALAAFPVTCLGENIAILNVASRTYEAMPEFSRNAIETIAGQIGSAFRRIEAQNKLAESEEKYAAVVEATQAGFIITDDSGHIEDANEKYIKLIGHESLNEIMGRKLSNWIAPKDKETVADAITSFTKTRSKGFLEIELVDSKGGTTAVEFSARLIELQGKTKIVNVCRDITERKLVEAHIDELNEKLRDTARQAGKAELATEVLHNVGNVLSSINISAETMKKRVVKSPLISLPTIVAMIDENKDNIGDFFSNHPKGQMLPEYFRRLSNSVKTERGEMERHLDDLARHVEHLKNVISTQQNYAKTASAMVKISLSETISDAMLVSNVSMKRTGVRFLKEIGSVPQILTNKQIILQILINLLGNAKHAVADVTVEPSIWVRLYQVGQLVQIEVEDNGHGITKENMPKLFSYGFTTKKNGHGFGLHSSYKAAQTLGGTLRAFSEGIGKGAIFTLELPAL